jgi:hypothetical protein
MLKIALREILIVLWPIFLSLIWLAHRLARIERLILRKEDQELKELDQLKTDVTDLVAADGALATSISGAVTELGTLEQQVAALQSAETVTPQDLTNLSAFVGTVKTHLTAAKAALDAAAAAAAPPATPPATPATPPATPATA